MVKWILLACVLVLLLAGLGAGGLWWWNNRPGEWSVNTEPAGATVTLDGHIVKSPNVITGLKPRDYEAKVVMEGFEPRTVKVTVSPGKRADIGPVTLVRSTGSLTVSSDPDGAEYTVKSLTHANVLPESGVTPKVLRLPAGKYEVTMTYDGQKKFGDVDVTTNNDTPKSFQFEKPQPAPVQPPAPVVAANTPPPAPVMPSSSDTPPEESSANIPPTPPAPAPSANNPPPAPMPPQVQPQPQPQPALPNVADAPPSAPAPNPAAMAAAASSAGGPDAPPSAPIPNTSTPPADGTVGPNAAAMAAAATQPAVGEPDDGHWKLDEIFSSSAYSGYSEAGRRYLLYKAQLGLKVGADGKVGPGTHKAIQKFQTANSLQPTGQLDGPTLAALELANLPDKSDWSPPRSSSGGGGRGSSSDRTPESEKTAARKFIERNILGGRDMKEMFKGKK